MATSIVVKTMEVQKYKNIFMILSKRKLRSTDVKNSNLLTRMMYSLP